MEFCLIPTFLVTNIFVRKLNSDLLPHKPGPKLQPKTKLFCHAPPQAISRVLRNSCNSVAFFEAVFMSFLFSSVISEPLLLMAKEKAETKKDVWVILCENTSL